jgi:hypothetical protein
MRQAHSRSDTQRYNLRSRDQCRAKRRQSSLCSDDSLAYDAAIVLNSQSSPIRSSAVFDCSKKKRRKKENEHQETNKTPSAAAKNRKVNDTSDKKKKKKNTISENAYATPLASFFTNDESSRHATTPRKGFNDDYSPTTAMKRAPVKNGGKVQLVFDEETPAGDVPQEKNDHNVQSGVGDKTPLKKSTGTPSDGMTTPRYIDRTNLVTPRDLFGTTTTTTPI